jgi:hypothetical protein
MDKGVKPTFMVVGAPKPGTTSFCKALSLHSDVFMTDPKEPFFFCHDGHYAKGLDWYESLYRGSESATARGEGSGTYSMHEIFPEAIKRIAEYSKKLEIHLSGPRTLQSYRVALDGVGEF